MLNMIWMLAFACSDDKETTENITEDTAMEDTDTTVVEDLDCTDWYADIWTVDVTEGSEVRVLVDTISDETAFDPAVFLSFDSIPQEGNLEEMFLANTECSYAPISEDGGCIDDSWTSTASGTLFVEIIVAQDPCNSDLAEYSLVINVDGEPVLPTLSMDDRLEE